jgi:hypothetical protein
MLTTAIPSGFSYSSKEAKEKVGAAEKALGNAQHADERLEKAKDNWEEKQSQHLKDYSDAVHKREEAEAASLKAYETGKEEDIEAAKKAREAAEAAEKKAQESEKALEQTTEALEQAKQELEAAKSQVPPLIESAEKAVDELPQSSVKKKLKERINKVKEDMKQLAFVPVFPTELDPEKVRMTLAGTKETIGHVANLNLANQTDETFLIRIPPTILASKTGKVQNYALTHPMEITLGPKETRAIPLTGVCLDARVPPAGPEDKDELSLLDPTTPDFESTWKPLLVGTQTVIHTTQELQKQGVYKTPYSKNPRKEFDTIVQWTAWLFVSTMQGKPVTKEDLSKKVFEQAEGARGPLPPEKKEEFKEGVDDIWDAIQLTGASAKVLPSGTVPISATPDLEQLKSEVEALKEIEQELEEEYKKAMEEFWEARDALVKSGIKPEIKVEGGIIIGDRKPRERPKYEPQTELEKDFLEKQEAVKEKEAELQEAALEREAAEKKLREAEKTQAAAQVPPPGPMPPVVVPQPPLAAAPKAEEAKEEICGAKGRNFLRTVEGEWRAGETGTFQTPGQEPTTKITWLIDVENEYEVYGECPLPKGHGGPHQPSKLEYEKLKTISQEETYPYSVRNPKPPKGPGFPKKPK